MKKLESGFCDLCSYELRSGFCYNCWGKVEVIEESVFTNRKEAKYCGETIRKMQEYIFNTAELPNYNISEDYLKQTITFLNELLNENK